MKFSMWTPEVAAHCRAALPHVRSVALFGIEAHVCVLQTALDLRDAGFDVHVVADGVSSTRQVRQNARGETDIPGRLPAGPAAYRVKEKTIFCERQQTCTDVKKCAFF
jgi:hypothetical protein